MTFFRWKICSWDWNVEFVSGLTRRFDLIR